MGQQAEAIQPLAERTDKTPVAPRLQKRIDAMEAMLKEKKFDPKSTFGTEFNAEMKADAAQREVYKALGRDEQNEFKLAWLNKKYDTTAVKFSKTRSWFRG